MKYSPLLAVVTGILEFGAAIWVLLGVRAGRKRILQPAGLILLFLAGYQFAEVAVCGHMEQKIWTQLAYFDITWLPPLGLWLAARLSEPRNRWLKIVAFIDFGLAAAFSAWILADPNSITKSVCELVIARYFPVRTFEVAYALFYQLSLLTIVFGSAFGMAFSADMILRKHLANLQTGLLGFLLPALAVQLLAVESEGGLLPSVMCHFAVVLAASLFVLVLRERRAGTKA